MNSLFIGQAKSGKTTHIQEHIKQLPGKKVILDFNNQYDDFSKNQFFLDDVNGILGEISANDARALNAGFVSGTHCLYRQAEEILREYQLEKKTGLIEETIERLHISWNDSEMAYAKIFTKKIPLRKNKKMMSVDDAIEKIMSDDITVIKTKSMHSDSVRGVGFALLSKLSWVAEEPIHIVSDELTNFFNTGNLKLFFRSINFETLHFHLAYNKVSSIPPLFMPLFDTLYIHRFENKTDLKELNKLGIENEKAIAKLNPKQHIEVKTKSLVLTQ